MNEKINQEQRAYIAWNVLTECARKNEPITYGELAKHIKIHHRAVRFVLGVVQDFCMSTELPPLTIIVLNKETGLPGDGFIAYDIENAKDGIEKVYKFNWSKLENPFDFAKEGTTENKLVDDLIDNPEKSEDVYSKVKVRGVAQKIFRQALLKIYENSCAVCGFSFSEALDASHIIPYSQSNPKQRLDVRNGLLLCSTHHKLFDSGYFSIDEDFRINYYDFEEKDGVYSEYDRLQTTKLHSQKLRLPKDKKHFPSKEYLAEHSKYY